MGGVTQHKNQHPQPCASECKAQEVSQTIFKAIAPGGFKDHKLGARGITGRRTDLRTERGGHGRVDGIVRDRVTPAGQGTLSAACATPGGVRRTALFFFPHAPLRPYRSSVAERQVKTEKKREPSCTQAG